METRAVFAGLLGESAVWTDKQAALAFGQLEAKRVVVLASMDYLPKLRLFLRKVEEDVRAREAIARKQEEEAKRASEMAQLAEREALEKELEAVKVQVQVADEARARAEAPKKVFVTTSPKFCECASDSTIVLRCEVRSGANVAVRAFVRGAARTNLGLASEGRSVVDLQPGEATTVNIQSQYSSALPCMSTRDCECSLDAVDATIGLREPVSGGLSKGEIAAVMKAGHADIRRCYEAQRGQSPNLAGKVAVRFVILGSGAVGQVEIDSSANHPALETCVASQVKSWQFPKPKGGGTVSVTYPLVFKAVH